VLQPSDRFAASAELKFITDGEPGQFEGYGAVHNKVDWHGDVILKGAFAQTLADHKAKGTMPAMFAEHSAFYGGDPLPIGVWQDLSEDDNGLRVKGKISGLDTDTGRRIRGLLQDGALRGLSIAFRVPPGGSTVGKKADEPKRTLRTVDLYAIDIVRDPSQAAARIDHVRSVMIQADHQTATGAIASAIKLHRSTMTGGNSPSGEERAKLLELLQGAHMALTGNSMPQGMRAVPNTIREFEAYLREEFGFSNSQARAVAEHGFKSSLPRDEGNDQAIVAERAALREIGANLRGFSLSKS
jgi:HK97 family phage prohead protease